MYAYKLNLIDSYKPVEGIRGKLGIPMALNMYELYPFWYRFFTELKFEVFHSPYSTRKLYQRGQQTIPSDTVCFPAKLVHGHIQTLIDMGAETIFYPCLSYNLTSISEITITTVLLLLTTPRLSKQYEGYTQGSLHKGILRYSPPERFS